MTFALLFFQLITLTPSSESVTLSLAKEYNSQEYGFYQLPHVLYSDEHFYSIDFGTKELIKIDRDGNLLMRRGREGSGPGEFMTPRRMSIVGDYIAIYDANKTLLFTKDGRHAKDIVGALMSKVFAHPSGNIGALYRSDNEKQYKYELYDQNFKQTFTNMYENDKQARNFAEIKKKMSSLYIHENTIYKTFMGSYELQIESLEKPDIFYRFTRKFKRIPRGKQQRFQYVTYGEKTKESVKRNKEFAQRMEAEYDKKYGKFLGDITAILGFYKGRLVLGLRDTEEKEIHLDFIDIEKKTYAISSIKFKDKVVRYSLNEDVFVVTLTNDEDGPYFVTLNVNVH